MHYEAIRQASLTTGGRRIPIVQSSSKSLGGLRSSLCALARYILCTPLLLLLPTVLLHLFCSDPDPVDPAMPHHPPLCPAFTHAQSLTLSPIQETVYSPLHPHENAVFADFSWAGVFSPVSRGTSPMLGSDGSKSPSSPGMLLSRLDQLTLQYSKIAPKAAAVPHTGVGLGFDLEIKLSNRVLADLPIGKERRHSSVSTYTPSAPANTPTAARNRRRYSSFLSREPVYNYEEDDVDPSQLAREVSESDEADLLPMMGWLQNRLEEAARREEYESDVDAIELDMPESSTLADIQTAIVTERKVVKVNVHRAVASLRRTESVLQTPPRSSAKVDDDAVGEDREVSKMSRYNRLTLMTFRSLPGTVYSPRLSWYLAGPP